MSTILVVDDNLDNRTIIGQMLQLSGYEVISAVDGLDALRVAEQASPDLILMDLAMPRLDGWGATAALKAKPNLAQIPVVAVTGHVTTDDLGRAMQAGCQDYVTKPVDYQVLLNKVRMYLPQ